MLLNCLNSPWCSAHHPGYLNSASLWAMMWAHLSNSWALSPSCFDLTTDHRLLLPPPSFCLFSLPAHSPPTGQKRSEIRTGRRSGPPVYGINLLLSIVILRVRVVMAKCVGEVMMESAQDDVLLGSTAVHIRN